MPQQPRGWGQIKTAQRGQMDLSFSDYSVDPTMIGRMVDVTADLQRVTIRWQGTLVGDHPRCWARHQTITDPAHRARGFELAHAHRHQPRERIDLATGEVQTAALAASDRFWGLDIILGAGR